MLFICKKRVSNYGVSYGLLNSATFVTEMLNHKGIDAKIVVVDDNNDIDREVYQYKPTHVIVEALWVIPEKFEILKALHPNVKWIVRIHSKTAFLAGESIAIDWIKKYLDYNVEVSFNNEGTCKTFNHIFKRNFIYLPNVYPICDENEYKNYPSSDYIHIGCFGALRLLKNQLQQAQAAILFARRIKKTLIFHINASDIEDAQSSILKNIEALFLHTGNILIKHKWMKHDEFVTLIRQMDIGLQVSLSESFNIVSADFISNSIPIVVSENIDWLPKQFQAELNVESIVERLEYVWNWRYNPSLIKFAERCLNRYSEKSSNVWIEYFYNDIKLSWWQKLIKIIKNLFR